MPYKIRKVRNKNCYSVKNLHTNKRVAKCTTLIKAKTQMRLLYALDSKKARGGKKRKSRKNKRKSRGGRLAQQDNNQEDDPNNALEEPAYQDVPNNEWVRLLDCPLNNFDEREVEYRWQQQTNRGLPRGAGHLSGSKAEWRDICQDFVRELTPEQIRRRRREQIRRRRREEEIAERRHRETNGGKNKTRKRTKI